MYKVITGKEALKRIADGEEVYFRERDNDAWSGLTPDILWSVSEFLSPDASCVFAIKTEPRRTSFTRMITSTQTVIDTEGFVCKAVRITVEEIEQ